MSEILIIGANGLVGRQVAEVCTERGISFTGTYCKRPVKDMLRLDITDKKAVTDIVLAEKPKVIFHCANFPGGVNACEEKQAEAEAFHLKATQYIGEAALTVGATLVFYSSDYVFDGTKGAAYTENDIPNPLNLYGKLKLAAEKWIAENLEKHLILRTTNLYGWDPDTITPNFLMGLYFNAKKNLPSNVPSYLYGNPTFANDVVRVAFRLLEKNAFGLYHAVSSEYLDRYTWAARFFTKFGLDLALLNKNEIAPVFSIPRPLKSNLCNKAVVATSGFAFTDLDTGLDLCREQSLGSANASG